MTSTEQQLPDNDRDLILARQLGTALATGEGISAVQDPLIGVLLEWKAEQEDASSILRDEDSAELWEQITQQIRKTKAARILPFYKTSAFNRIAVAATILIAAFTGLFLYQNSQPVVIGESIAEMQTVLLEDGSEIILRPHSRLLALDVNDDERSYRLDGEGFFNVANDPSRPFSVEAGSGTVTVLGTRFNLSSWGNRTHVYLEEGSVRFTGDADQMVVLEPGENALLKNGSMTRPAVAEAETFKDWINNTLVLNNTTVQEAVEELEHHYDIIVDASQVDDPDELLGGSIQLGTTEETLQDLGVILSGTFRETGSGRYRFIPLN